MNANTTSVDLFLERRPQFVEIGKVAIASVLLPAEANSRKTMFEPWACHADAQRRASQGWYQYFASEMRLSYGDWGRGLLTIITYNYDRSFEYYLFTILRSSCDKSEPECWQKFKEIPIIHLHGHLGMLDRTLSTFVQYGSLDANVAIQASKEIKIIHEVKPTEEQFSGAQGALDEAEVVCFLGFGYARENMQRLEWRRGHRNKKLLGTVYGLTDAEQRRLGIGRYFNITSSIPSGWGILQVLRETDLLG